MAKYNPNLTYKEQQEKWKPKQAEKKGISLYEWEIIEDLQQYAYILHRDRYSAFNLEDIESEILFWAGNRLEHLYETKQQDEMKYRGYLKKSIPRLINKMTLEENVIRKMTTSYSKYDEDSVIESDTILTVAYATDLVEDGNEIIFKRLKEICTPYRYQILEDLFINKIPKDVLANNLGITQQAVTHHVKGGVDLLIVKQ